MSHTRSNRSWRPWKALLLAGLLALCLTGCAKQSENTPTLSYAEMLAMMNQPVESGFEENPYPVRWGTHGGRIWAYGMQQGGKDWYLASAKPDGTDFQFLPLESFRGEKLKQQWAVAEEAYPDEEIFAANFILGYCFDDVDNLLLVAEEYVAFNVMEEERMETCYSEHFLCTWGEDGTLQRGPTLQLPPEVDGYIFGAQVLNPGEDQTFWVHFEYAEPNTGQFTASAYVRFSAVDGRCREVVALPEGLYAYSHCALSDGSLLIYAIHDNGPTQQNRTQLFLLRTQDGHTTLEPMDISTFPEKWLGGLLYFAPPVQGPSDQEFWLWNWDDLYRVDLAEGEIQHLLSWEEYGVNGLKLRAVFALSPTQFVLAFQSGKLRTVTLMDANALAGRPMVTLGVLDHPNLKELKAQVTAYNATGPEVYVGIVPYTNAAAEKGFSSGGEQLYNDILRGSAPDILLLPNDMDIDGLVGKGVFIDLYPYLDADAELARDDFVPGILSACTYNGTLPTVVPSYTLLTAAGSAALVGDAPGWAWQDYDALLAAHPDAVPFYGFARQNILLYLLQMGGDAFIDRQTGQAHLDGPDFVRLLQASAAYPAQAADLTQDPKPAFSDGEALLQVQFVTKWRDVLTLEYLFDGNFTFKGFPGAGAGNPTGSAVVPALRLGVTRYCQNPQAAWQFLRTLLLPGYQDKLAAPDSTAFPLRQDALAAAAATATQPYEAATPPLFLESADLTDSQLAHWQQGLTQAQADQLSALLGAQTTLYQYDATIAAIVWEEADAFYNGQRPAAEAAALMQARVQTYLDEND